MSPAPITYYALDLEERELSRTLEQLSASSTGSELKGKVETRGMWGTYDGGLKFIDEGGLQRSDISQPAVPAATEYMRTQAVGISSNGNRSPSLDSMSSRRSTTGTESINTAPSTPDPASSNTPLHIMFLGSSLGNFTRGDDAAFLKAFPLRPGSRDTLLLGLDHGNDKDRIEKAYNDSRGITRDFILNGLKNAGRTFGDENLFDEDKWEYIGRYNEEESAYPWFYSGVRYY